MKQRRIFAVMLLTLLPLLARAQEAADWTYSSSFNFGFNLYFNTGKGQKFPGWKAFCGLSATATNKHHVLFNYGPSLALYSRSLGANLNPLGDDVQLDFAHSFSAGPWWGDAPGYTKHFRTLGNAAYYNTALNVRNDILLTTIFVFNNHKRNQSLGALSGTFGDFTINYYNDGGLPIELLPISDHFDRYWTGGLGLFFHNNSGFNYAEFSFDQFTGYEPLLYEVSSLLGIRVPDYNHTKGGDAQDLTTNFNTSAYNLRIMPYAGFGVDVGAIGALQLRNGIPCGLQDIIHTIGHYALHPNNDVSRFYIGGTYIYSVHEPF